MESFGNEQIADRRQLVYTTEKTETERRAKNTGQRMESSRGCYQESGLVAKGLQYEILDNEATRGGSGNSP